jgi:hypothetical protein
MFKDIMTALIITRREVRDQFRDWRIIFPVLGLTIFFPFLMNFTAQQMLDFVNQYGASLIGERLVPFLMMIVGFFPISVSLVIALETFVGERERGSIEPLLNTPLKDWQLYLGKLLAAIVPPLLASFLGMTVYLAGLAIGRVTLPEPMMMFQIVVLTIVQAVVMVSGAVVVSTQATSIRSANLLSSFIIIPAALLIQGESVVMFWGTNDTLWWAVVGLLVLTALLVRVGLAHFQREELLGREIDVLNLKWGWQVFKNQFNGDAHSIFAWYRNEIPASLRRVRISIAAVAVLGAVAFWLGMQQADQFQIPIESTGFQNLEERLMSIIQILPVFSLLPVLLVWWQNLRVLILSLLLGAITFGILGVLPVLFSIGVVGYLMSFLSANGISSAQYLLGFILPHGIIEIPAAILAAAAVLHGGVMLATIGTGKTIGESWLESVAEWAKIMVGLVIPLLLLAACVEMWVTPRVALWLIPLLSAQ